MPERKRIFQTILTALSALLLFACATESDFSQAEAETVFGAVEAPAGETIVAVFAHFEEQPAENTLITVTDDNRIEGTLNGPEGGEATISGQADYIPKEELTPAAVDANAILDLSGYAINGLILDGELHLDYLGDRQSFTRIMKGDVIVSGKLSGSLPIDLTIIDSGNKREWTGSLGSHVYDSETSY